MKRMKNKEHHKRYNKGSYRLEVFHVQRIIYLSVVLPLGSKSKLDRDEVKIVAGGRLPLKLGRKYDIRLCHKFVCYDTGTGH